MRSHLVSTAATVGRCHRCRTQTLHGWAEGLLVHVDPVPLTLTGADQLAATGRAVYVLAHQQLVHRDDTRLALAGLLLPEHACGQPAPAELRAVLPTHTNPVRTETPRCPASPASTVVIHLSASSPTTWPPTAGRSLSRPAPAGRAPTSPAPPGCTGK